jgi:hypothetical protein
MSIDWNYQSQSNDMQSLSWAYKLDEDFYGTSTSATQVDGNDSVDGSSWLSGVSYGSHTLYVALLDQADSNNVLDTDHHTFTYQSGSGGTQSGTSGTQSPDSVYIAYPNVGTLYSSDGNGLSIDWNYQSQSNDMQSLSWAYKLDEDFYGTGTSATQVDGNDSVEGSTWLSGITADGQTHTLYVALLDGIGNALAEDQHSFTYNAGSDPYSSGGSGTQSPGDSISIQKPTSGDNVSSHDDLVISYTYSSANGGSSYPAKWAYKLYDPNYGTPFSSYSSSHGGTQVDYTNTEYDFMSGQSDGPYTVYVTLLDSSGDMFNPPITDHVSFTYQSSTGNTSSPGGGYQDQINIIQPVETSIIERNATLSVDISYASEVSRSGPPRWAYKLNENFYSTQTSAIEVNSTSVDGWLDDLEDGEHTLYVALLETYGGDYILAEDNVTFELVGEDDYENPPFFYFDDIDLSEITDRDDLAEGNYTILKDHNSSESSYFDIAPVYRDENGYILVEFDSAVSSSIDFTSLEKYLDGNFMEPIGFVDYMPFDFHPIDRIDLNNSSDLQSLVSGYNSVFYQEYTPRSWFDFEDFNQSEIDSDKFDFSYFAGGLFPSIENGKGILSGNSSTGSDLFSMPDYMGLSESDMPTDQGNSALFINDDSVFGIELDVTIPSLGNSQEVRFFVDLVDKSGDAETSHHELIELSWRSNGLNWNWEELDDQNQIVYKQKSADFDQTYRLSVVHNGTYTHYSIDNEKIAVIEGDFSPQTWLLGAFNDASQAFRVIIDNVQVLRSESDDLKYWALSIEQEEDNYDSNKSDLVVDMAGFVYEGDFGDYWYHWFGLSTYEPNVRRGDTRIVIGVNITSSFQMVRLVMSIQLFPQIGQDHSLFSKSEFNMTENNELNITIGNVQITTSRTVW